MGDTMLGQSADRLSCVLGSCIGVALYLPRHQVGVLAHVVLPVSSGRAGSPGKFADTAVPHMIRTLRDAGFPITGAVAKIAGGANMFASSGPLQIGDANCEAVTRYLLAAGIHVSAKDVGGNSGRRMVFDCSDGRVTIEVAGKTTHTL